jgi:hypothetical protein
LMQDAFNGLWRILLAIVDRHQHTDYRFPTRHNANNPASQDPK